MPLKQKRAGGMPNVLSASIEQPSIAGDPYRARSRSSWLTTSLKWNSLAERLFGLGAATAEAIIVLGTILIIILILLLIGALPAWPYSTGRGYYPGAAASRLSW